MTTETDQLTMPVAIVGFGWMGRVHAQAYSRVRHHYPQSARFPELVAIADDVPGRAAEAARQFGARAAVTDWHAVVDDPSIRAVSVTAPNFLHRDIGTAVVNAGKHLWIEKPVGLNASDALAVARAAEAQGVTTAVGFNYRNAPAVAAARELIAAGELGEITHARFYFLSDYAAHPDGALSWRFQRARGGNGVLGDLASHGVDLVRYLLGEVESVFADTAIFISQRPSRPEPPVGISWPAAATATRWRTRTTSSRRCGSHQAHGARWKPAEFRWGSRTPTGSRSTARQAS
jgi:predicted dehydrogenase